ALLAVSQLGRDEQLAFLADLHARNAFLPTLNHIAGQGQRERFTPVETGVELLAVARQGPGVVNLDAVAVLALIALAFLEDLVREARGQFDAVLVVVSAASAAHAQQAEADHARSDEQEQGPECLQQGGFLLVHRSLSLSCRTCGVCLNSGHIPGSASASAP